MILQKDIWKGRVLITEEVRELFLSKRFFSLCLKNKPQEFLTVEEELSKSGLTMFSGEQ